MVSFSSELQELFSQNDFPEDCIPLDKLFYGRKIIVYGAGEAFHYFHEVIMKKYSYMPCVVLDQKFQKGDVFAGIPACSPNAYFPGKEERCDGVAVICLGNQQVITAIVSLLKEKGFRNIITLRDIYEIHNPFELPKELSDKGFSYYLEHQQDIQRAFDLMEDDESRSVFTACLKTHMTRKPVAIPMRPRNEQYIPRDVPLRRGHSRWLSCGASRGDLERLFEQLGFIEEFLCFEPDPNQFQDIASYFEGHGRHVAKRITILPCAVYNEVPLKPFVYSETSFGSRIVPESAFWVQAVTIDKVVPAFNPTFLSMDIEGAEGEALKGATRTLRENHPDLAICLYHSPAHLWEIPLLLAQLNPAYRFYLRNYTSFIYETVLYTTTVL